MPRAISSLVDPRLATKDIHDFSKFDKHRWSEETKSSVFIKRIPDWLDKENIRCLFDSGYNPIAVVSRVHIVDVSPDKGSGRIAFVHFDDWHNTPESHKFRDIIVETDNFVKVVTNPTNTQEKYYLNMTANRRPIAVTTYDNDQLSDMINNANKTMAMLNKNVAMMQGIISAQNDRISHLEMLLEPMVRETTFCLDAAEKADTRRRILEVLSRGDLVSQPALRVEDLVS